ncbi:hypothetical protein KC644_02760 [Candidatus Berkelbacteria bacterium]|nr:hypothetical protein [Candidatus Berkelbacteria bacterium]
MKKIFQILGILVVVSLIFLVVNNGQKNQSDNPGSITADSQIDSQIISNSIISLAKTGSVATLLEDGGQLYIFNTHRQKYLKDSLLNFPNATTFLGTSQPENLIYYNATETKSGWYYFNLKSRQETKLNESISIPTVSADGKRLIYIFNNPDQSQSLVVSDINGQNFNRILNTEEGYEQLSWGPKETYVLGLDTLSVPPGWNLIYLSSKKEEQITNGYGESLWSPNGEQVLVDGLKNLELIAIETATSRSTATSSVALTTWINNEKFLNYDPTANQLNIFNQETLEIVDQIDWPTTQPTRLIGLEEGKLYFLAENTLAQIDISSILK